MSFLDLPNELLGYVARHTCHEEFESLALTCRRNLDACRPYINQHNEFKHTWKDVRLNDHDHPDEETPDCPHATPVRTALQLICLIASNPSIGRCVKRLRLEDENERHHQEDTQSLRQSLNVLTKLERLLDDSLHLQEAKIDSRYWLKLMLADDERTTMFTTAFLFTLLPNTTALSLPQWWRLDAPDIRPSSSPNDSDLAGELLRVTSKRANQCRGASLSNLNTIWPSTDEAYQTFTDLSDYGWLLAINSVEGFYAGNCVASSHDEGASFPPASSWYGTCGLRLETMELVGA